MIRILIRSAALTALIGLGACDLAVQNPNQPETERVLASPTDIESLLGSYYRRWHEGVYRTLGNIQGMANVQSFEDYSSLSNNCMGQRVGIPRPANGNSVGNVCAAEQARLYFVEGEVNRVATTILVRLEQPGFTLGSPAQDLRAKAFGEFLRGLSLGYIALFHDSSAVISPKMSEAPADCLPDAASGVCVGALRGYREVMDSALVAMQRAIDYANTSAAGSGGFPLPAAWIPSSTTYSAAEFVRLVRSYRARFSAGVARGATERAAVNWDAIIADAQNGIAVSHDNITNTVSGPFNSWLNQYYAYGTWHQMTPFVVGMADVSGSYAAWIAKPLSDRGTDGAFFMVTPDLRFPQGATRAAQQADFAITSCNAASTTCKRYFVNRPAGNDQFSGNGWGWSNYDHARFWSWRTSGDGTGQNGKLVFFTKAELDMLEAEGHIRKGNYSAAATLINKTRTVAGLPALTAFDAVSPVPGGAACVPKVPVPPNFNTISCGNMMEAMKYEKRIETAYTHFAAWFQDSRGWGDLAAGTGLHWPVPYQDLQARGRTADQIYSTGGGTNSGSATAGTYGW